MRTQLPIARGIRQRGSALIEGALTLTVFIVTLFGIMDFSRMVWVYNQLSNGAREATRYAIVHGSASGSQASVSQIQAVVTNSSPGLSAGSLTTTVTFTPDQDPGSLAKVVVTYNFYPLSPYIPVGPIRLASTSQRTIYQ